MSYLILGSTLGVAFATLTSIAARLVLGRTLADDIGGGIFMLFGFVAGMFGGAAGSVLTGVMMAKRLNRRFGVSE